MKILYDHQIFSTQLYGGVSRYYCELAKNLFLHEGIDVEISVMFSNNKYLRSCGFNEINRYFPKSDFWGKMASLAFINKQESKKALLKGDFTIFHPTNYDPYFIEYLRDKPFVMTIHDMIHELFPNEFPPNNRVAKNKKFLANMADRIITVSENTKNDLIDILGIEDKKIEVIYHGSSWSPRKMGIGKDRQAAGRYLLYVGARNAYKNFIPFLEAISPLCKKYGDLQIICVGGGGFLPLELEAFAELDLVGKIVYQSIDDIGLAELYQNAKAFVFPSRYEGFGIPILEAFSSGCPVVLSNVGSLREVARDAAEYFIPEDKDSILCSVERVILDGELRDSMRKKGFERLKAFRWSRTASLTKLLYQSVLK